MPSLIADGRAAAAGLARLVRGRADWAAGFDLTTAGFVRSFGAPLVALPLYVGAVALVEHTPSAATLWSAGLAHLADAFGFPLLLAAIAGLMRFKAGYAAFVIVNNWAAFYLKLFLASSGLLTLLGPDGVQAFNWSRLVLLIAMVGLVWRIASKTLSQELAPIVLVVVLCIGWSAGVDQAAHWLLGA